MVGPLVQVFQRLGRVAAAATIPLVRSSFENYPRTTIFLGLVFGGSLITAGYQLNPFRTHEHDVLHEAPIVTLHKQPVYRSSKFEEEEKEAPAPTPTESKAN